MESCFEIIREGSLITAEDGSWIPLKRYPNASASSIARLHPWPRSVLAKYSRQLSIFPKSMHEGLTGCDGMSGIADENYLLCNPII